MYIIFNENNDEFLRYYLEELPEELKKYNYKKIDEDDIPEKEGYLVQARLEDNEIVWEYKKIEKSIDTEEYIKELEEEIKKQESTNKTAMMGILELANRVRVLEGSLND